MKKFKASLLFAVMALAAATVFAQPEVIVHHKINTHSQSPNHTDFSATTGGTAATSALVYHGGKLINTPTIYIIWYGNWNRGNGTDTPAGQALIRAWASGIGNSPWFQINTGNSVSGFPISGNVSFTPTANETTDGGKTRLRDSDISTSVNNAINSGRLRYDPNGVYFVVTSSDISEQSGFCTQYCGWHTAGNLSAGRVRYSFVGNAARCLTSCAEQSVSPNGNAGIDGAISVMSHELAEATTDPDLNAWYDSSGAENADKCAWTFGHYQFQEPNGSWANESWGGHDWLIQRNLMKSGSSWFCMSDTTHN